MSRKNRLSSGIKLDRSLVVLVSLAALLLLSVVGTLAFITMVTNPVHNVFTPTEVACEVVKDGNSYTVKNTGDIPAYLRAAVVVTWQDGDGNVYSTAPVEDTDYDMTLPVNSKWFERDGFWYYSDPVPATANANLAGALVTVTQRQGVSAPAEGFHLTVDIVAQAIQADGDINGIPAAEDAWQVVTVSGGQLIAK